MIYRLAVPYVGDEVEEIRVLEWRGQVGDAIGRGDLIVELETHKALVEVRAGQDGILRKKLADDGDWIRIGAAFALFSDSLEEAITSEGEAGDLAVEFFVD